MLASPNLALICDRGSKISPISNLFVTNMLCDLHVNGSGSYAFLLYRLGSKRVNEWACYLNFR
ncbi:DNA methyltransferase [Helicobacter pylori]|nr:DNA methyltransferase [Helicobacter pylori]